MNQNLNLNIQKPCSEKFDQFEPTPLGGFCPSCQKEVIDFTAMTDLEILEYFRGNPKNTCGRFFKSQLKTYQGHSPTSKKSNFHWTGLHLLGLSILPFLGIQHAHAQHLEKNISLQVPQELEKSTVSEKDAMQNHLVKGDIIDEETAEPSIGVNIVLEGTNIGTTTDINGQFEFFAPLKAGDVLIFSGVGYETQKFTIPKNAPETIQVTIQLKVSHVELSGEVSTSEVYTSKRSFWQKLKNMFR